MADATIIVGKLDSKEMEKSIEKLVETINDKMLDASTSFDDGLSLMDDSLKKFSQKAKTTINDIKNTFSQLGTTFDDFAKAMQKAANAAAAASGASGGSGGGTGGGGAASGGSGGPTASNTIGGLKEQIRLQEKKVDAQQRGTAAAQAEVNIHRELQRQLKEETKSTQQKNAELAKSRLQNAMSMPTSNLNEAERRLRLLEAIQRRYANTTELSVQQQNRLAQAISKTKAQIDKFKVQPPTLKDVIGMDESSVDAIAKKMSALKKVSIDPNNANQVRQLGTEYQRLSRLQSELLGRGVQLTHSNNYLAQSFGYIRNRIVYALTLGAVTNFMKQLYEIRGQYELLERSIGILVDSAERGSQVFNELNEMAIKSPFTLIELGGAAKQLAAYNFTADELVDTTRRLADISAALGVPMERLVYNLGQIKAQGRLNARDARDFANAGLAIVPMLAQLYTETKRFGDQQVTTAQVYDMITKKMVSYQDVLQVVYRATDEGGKFFNFQERQAGTLKVQIANLSLAYNNMLNEIGTENQDALSKPLQLMRWVFKNWRDIYDAIKAVILIIGIYKAQAMLAFAGDIIRKAVVAYKELGGAIGIAKNAQVLFNAAVSSNPIGLVLTMLASYVAYTSLFGNKVEEVSQDVENFGESTAKTLNKVETYRKILTSIDAGSNTYKKTLAELNTILQEYGIETAKEGDSLDVINKKRERAIELIKQEGIERQYANKVQQGNDRYTKQIDAATQELTSKLKNATTKNAIGYVVANEQIRENADAISAIVSQIVQEDIALIANKTGDEYDRGLTQIFERIQVAMRTIGLDEKTITKQWLDDNLFLHGNIIQNYIDACQNAKVANDNYTKSITTWYKEQKAANASTMSLTERIKAYERALQKPTDDTYKLYENIAMLVRDYAKQHNIDFNVRFKAQVPPSWMNAKDLPELQNLAKRFAALAQAYPGGTNVGGGKGDKGTFFTQEQLWERALQYAEAAKEKEAAASTDAAREAEEEKQRKKDAAKAERERAKAERQARQQAAAARREQVQQENEVAKALKDEISLIKEMQGNYEKLRKAGFKNTDAMNIASMGYEDTIKRINDVLKKYNISEFKTEDFAGKDVNQLLEALKKQREELKNSGKAKTDSIKAFDFEIQKLNVEAKTFNMQKITDGLNNELGKLKDEYELALELDANPELSDMFKDMFNIDTSDFPHSIDEYVERAQALFDKLVDASGYEKSLNILTATEKEWKEWGEAVGISDEKLKDIKAKFDGVANTSKKWARDVLKQTQDLQYKLGDINEKIAIEEKNLADLKTQLAKSVNDKQRALLQLQIEEQEEAIQKLKEEILEQMPFYENLFNGISDRSRNVMKKYINDAKNILKNSVVGYDKKGNKTYTLSQTVNGETKTTTISAKRYERLIKQINEEVEKQETIWDRIKRHIKGTESEGKNFALAMHEIGEELKKLGEFVNAIGEITEALGLDEENQEYVNDFAATLEGLGQAADGLSKIKSGDIIGGATDMVSGLWKSVSTWLDNSDKKITREINKSKRAVQELEIAYNNLQYAIENSLGAGEIYARKNALTNKQLQLQEKEKQLELEKSRKKKKRDEDAIMSLESEISDLRNEINSLASDVANTLLGGDIKSAAEDFVSTWVNAWRQGENTMDALGNKFDNMIDTMIAKSLASKVVAKRLQPIYDIIDTITGTETDEQMKEKLKQVKDFIGDGSFAKDIDTFLTELYGYLGINQGAGSKNLSALQQGIQSITEDTAGALEAYMNGVSQQVYYQSDLLTQIRDAVVAIDSDVTMATQAQILLQLQNTYTLMQAMNSLMNGWTTPNGQGVRVELIN